MSTLAISFKCAFGLTIPCEVELVNTYSVMVSKLLSIGSIGINICHEICFAFVCVCVCMFSFCLCVCFILILNISRQSNEHFLHDQGSYSANT